MRSALKTTSAVTPEQFVNLIRDALAPLADAQRAAAMQAYMRGQFEFLGVATPQRRSVTMPLLRLQCGADELVELARTLWVLPQREYQYVAIDMLARNWKALAMRHVDDLLALTQQGSWWDSVDGLAGIVGDLTRTAREGDRGAQRAMDAALRHPDMWVRRVAMLHQLGWRTETDASRLFSYAIELAAEPDFFIRKAIGWALRDYARHDPQAVRSFLQDARNRLSALSMREAAKHLGTVRE
jgi:3-methyladenine DNA glycosylase AlkD